MANILLINPSYFASYGSSKASITNPIFPTLGLTTIAATALERGHKVNICDLSYQKYDPNYIKTIILETKPDIVGITATTPLMNQLRDISLLCKDISQSITVVGGGSHVSAMPIESMHESKLDLILAGEADYTFAEICDGKKASETLGVYYRGENGSIIYSGNRPLVENLDDLPMPAWHLFNSEFYKNKMSRLLVRQPPAIMAEFSRGCVYQCDFCASKITMALGYRKKSPERCAEEVKLMSKLGWREFMLADDIFTSDQNWAVKVCNAISKTNTKMSWSCTNGIRVESANKELFKAMKDSGCYRVSFGFESGNDAILKAFGKGGKATITQGKIAVRQAREAGIDTNGFFMLGLSPDTPESMMDTIKFAKTLELDMLKFGIAIAFPGTPMFNSYLSKGLIKSFDWDEYHIYTAKPLFSHANLNYETITKFMSLAYREVIFKNPKFIIRRIARGFKTGEFFWDLFYALRFALLPATSSKEGEVIYYNRERWPQHNYTKKSHIPISPIKVTKKNNYIAI